MRALVVYESMYGNTHVVAGNIADGLRATYEVTLVPVAEVTAELVAGTDLLVAGTPTHMHGRYGPACESDPALGYELTRRLARVVAKRLQATRVRLITASSQPADVR